MKLILPLTIVLLFLGCSSKVEYIDRPRDVYIPVKCQVPMPTPPTPAKDMEGVRNLSIYTESLKCALKLCRGETCDEIK